MGWFGASQDGQHSNVSPAVAQIEQQIEMMDMVFMKYIYTYWDAFQASWCIYLVYRAVKQCSRKCIPMPYKDGELNKGESVCTSRCLNKFFDVLETVSMQLAEVGMQTQGTPSI